jgi:hypothetical protein
MDRVAKVQVETAGQIGTWDVWTSATGEMYAARPVITAPRRTSLRAICPPDP